MQPKSIVTSASNTVSFNSPSFETTDVASDGGVQPYIISTKHQCNRYQCGYQGGGQHEQPIWCPVYFTYLAEYVNGETRPFLRKGYTVEFGSDFIKDGQDDLCNKANGKRYRLYEDGSYSDDYNPKKIVGECLPVLDTMKYEQLGFGSARGTAFICNVRVYSYPARELVFETPNMLVNQVPVIDQSDRNGWEYNVDYISKHHPQILKTHSEAVSMLKSL